MTRSLLAGVAVTVLAVFLYQTYDDYTWNPIRVTVRAFRGLTGTMDKRIASETTAGGNAVLDQQAAEKRVDPGGLRDPMLKGRAAGGQFTFKYRPLQ